MRQYSKKIEELYTEYHSNSSGLSDSQYSDNLEKFGLNELKEKEKDSVLKIFLSQFKDFLVVVLIIANIVSILTKNIESAVVILVVILINAILGTVQYVKAEKSLNSLKKLSSPYSKVLRNGIQIEVESSKVVPGDIVILEAGDYVPADGRIIENYSLQVNESSLTGESEPVNKSSELMEDKDFPIGDRANMVFSGSLVTYGKAKVIVTETGMNTEIGKIAQLLESTKEKKTPLQISLDDFSKKLSIGILIICLIVFALSIYRNQNILDALMFAIALAVAAVPEALSSIVTIVLAIGTQNMAKENAIVKELKAVEGLGSISVICSDKTGTLTQNKMTVVKSFIDFKEEEIKDFKIDNISKKHIISSCILCNNSEVHEDKEVGDPTETALITMSKNLSVDTGKTRFEHIRLDEVPFDSDRKLMSTVNLIKDKKFIYTKGAVDVLMSRAKSVFYNNEVIPLTDELREKIINANEKFSKEGLRVLAFASKETDKEDISKDDEFELTFIGLLAMIDPPREEAKEAVKDCKMAGIKPVMITGDHKITASAIAKQIGILEDGDLAITGEELDKINDKEYFNLIEKISVYARVSPSHKIKIVQTWQEKNKIVAMTGDGVNDAPALKQADIGIAMGITGTDVSKDAASMILTDDNFATIIKALTSGRNIFRNITNSIGYLLSGNASAIIVVLLASIFALPIPFSPVHLLFINLVTDSLPAIAIGMEPERKYLLKEKPRDKNASILDRPFLNKIGIQGVLISITVMASFLYGLKVQDGAFARTLSFSTLCLARLFHGFNCRGKYSLLKMGVFSNKFSWFSFLIGNVLLLIMLKIYPFNHLFEASFLDGKSLGIVYILAIIPTLLIQLYRIIFIDRKA